jgi:hypothetical protein
MQSTGEKILIIALFIYTIPACSTIDHSDDGKVIIHQKKYEDSTGDCEGEYSDNCARIKIEFPQVEYLQDQAVENKINRAIRKFFLQPLLNESSFGDVEEMIDNFLREYQSFTNDFPEAFQQWSLERIGKVKQNSDFIFSLELSEYSYLGGAHPNTVVNFVNYNLKSGEKIKLSELFKDNFENDLNRIAESEFRKLKDLSEKEDLGQAGFWFDDNRFHLNDNFLVTDSSLIFYYNNYEITAYAFGPTELKISYSKIKDLLNIDGLLAELLK